MAETPSDNAPAWRFVSAPLRLLMALAVLAGLIGLVAAQPPGLSLAAAKTGAGQNLQVIDGDTLQSGGDIIQLYGIDAPELGQLCLREGKPWQCGVEAAFALQKLVMLSGKPVVCETWQGSAETEGPNGEVIRVCQLGNDQTLGLALLRSGHSVALPDSFPYYGQLERQAKEAGLGIWGSQFTPPWDWRDGHRAGAMASEPAGDCNVKGTLDADGQRIYLVPTDDGYEAATMNQAKGEQLFCSDEEARQAGWQRPGQTNASAVR